MRGPLAARLGPGHREAFRGTLAYSAGPAAGIVTGPVLARLLGPEGRGQYAAVLQPLTLAEALAGLGLPIALTYFVARGADPGRALLAARRSALSSTALVFLVLAAYAVLLSHRQHLSYPLMLAVWSTLFLVTAANLLRAVRAGQHDFGRVDAEKGLAAGSRVVLIVGAGLLGVTSPLLLASLSVLAVLLGALVLLRGRSGGDGAELEPAPLLAYGRAAYPGVVASSFNARLDQALLPSFVASGPLGLYSVAVTLAELPLVIAQVAQRSILPRVAAAGAVTAGTRRAALAAVAGVAVLAGLGALLAPALLGFVFGRDFRSAEPYLVLLLAATVFATVTACLSAVSQGLGRPQAVSAAQARGAVVTCAGLALAAAQSSAMIAAATTVASQVAVALFLAQSLHRARAERSAPFDPARVPEGGPRREQS